MLKVQNIFLAIFSQVSKYLDVKDSTFDLPRESASFVIGTTKFCFYIYGGDNGFIMHKLIPEYAAKSEFPYVNIEHPQDFMRLYSDYFLKELCREKREQKECIEFLESENFRLKRRVEELEEEISLLPDGELILEARDRFLSNFDKLKNL